MSGNNSTNILNLLFFPHPLFSLPSLTCLLIFEWSDLTKTAPRLCLFRNPALTWCLLTVTGERLASWITSLARCLRSTNQKHLLERPPCALGFGSRSGISAQITWRGRAARGYRERRHAHQCFAKDKDGLSLVFHMFLQMSNVKLHQRYRYILCANLDEILK